MAGMCCRDSTKKGQWRRKIDEEESIAKTVYLEEMSGKRPRGRTRQDGKMARFDNVYRTIFMN